MVCIENKNVEDYIYIVPAKTKQLACCFGYNDGKLCSVANPLYRSLAYHKASIPIHVHRSISTTLAAQLH